MPDSACASFNPHIADAQAPWAGTPYWTLKFTLGLAGSVLAALGPACTLLVRRCGTCTGRGPFALSCALCATRMFQVEAGLHCADTKYQITRCRCACALQEVPPVSTLPVLRSTTSWFRLFHVLCAPSNIPGCGQLAFAVSHCGLLSRLGIS